DLEHTGITLNLLDEIGVKSSRLSVRAMIPYHKKFPEISTTVTRANYDSNGAGSGFRFNKAIWKELFNDNELFAMGHTTYN